MFRFEDLTNEVFELVPRDSIFRGFIFELGTIGVSSDFKQRPLLYTTPDLAFRDFSMRANENPNKLPGSEFDDNLNGGGGGDLIMGRGGEDHGWGGAGNDLIIGGSGNDMLDGGTGTDTLFGGTDEDRLYGHDGDDHLFGRAGADFLYGGAGDDRMFGGAANDVLISQSGNDFLAGDSGADRLLVVGTDAALIRLEGGAGRDSFEFFNDGSVNVILDYEAGRDRVELSNAGRGLSEGDLFHPQDFSPTSFAEDYGAQTLADVDKAALLQGTGISYTENARGDAVIFDEDRSFKLVFQGIGTEEVQAGDLEALNLFSQGLVFFIDG